MNESIEKSSDYFKYPDIEHEWTEFKRVSREFKEKREFQNEFNVSEEFEIDSSVLMFLAQQGEMISLSEDIWSSLENTCSNKFEAGEWEEVHDRSNPNGVQKRDWEELRSKFDAGIALDAPIIMKFVIGIIWFQAILG